MKFISTRGKSAAIGIDQALLAGLADDGGLYVPEAIPQLSPAAISALADADLATCAGAVLAPYFAQSSLREGLDELCRSAYSFAAPLRTLNHPRDHLLELFHGPTAAFKDYAARFLAEALSALRAPDAAPITVLVATSGDTGAAVAAGFHRRPGFRVVILYPDGKVSPRQAHGLACWGDNVSCYRVDGHFDDCQRLAKQALADGELRSQTALTTANSISLGRLLPQAAYYAQCSARVHAEYGERLNLIVPTGNLGNACAAVLAQRMGFPIGEVRLATNANRTLPDYFEGEDYRARDAVPTLANAMDVGAPSNFERLRHWHASDQQLRDQIAAASVSDEQIRQSIAAAETTHGVVPCPHTAAGLHLLDQLRRDGDDRHWAVVATAHPAKFVEVVEPLVGHAVPAPPALQACLDRPAASQPMAADYAALRDVLTNLE